MPEFEDFDLRFWVKLGLVERAPARTREFVKRNRPNGFRRTSVAVSLAAAIATVCYTSPALASQVQSAWSGYIQPSALDDPSLVPGNPEDYWGALGRDIAGWQVADESDPIEDVPPIF